MNLSFPLKNMSNERIFDKFSIRWYWWNNGESQFTGIYYSANWITRNSSPICHLCADQTHEDQLHAFFHCSRSNHASRALLDTISSMVPQATPKKILVLDFLAKESLEFHVTWMIVNSLQIMWKLRVEKKQVRLFSIRSDLEARASLLRETRYGEHQETILELLRNYYQWMM